ncbi:UNVERIFIED_CONTAM: hypothetical protein H355_003779 [Colinus virginianus]|nr:hypothetical protein H355_003779 [Colinus virginianus]
MQVKEKRRVQATAEKTRRALALTEANRQRLYAYLQTRRYTMGHGKKLLKRATYAALKNAASNSSVDKNVYCVQKRLFWNKETRRLAFQEFRLDTPYIDALVDEIRKKEKYMRATNKAAAEVEKAALEAARAEELRNLQYERDYERVRFLMSLDIHNLGVTDPFANDTSQAGGVGGASTHLILESGRGQLQESFLWSLVTEYTQVLHCEHPQTRIFELMHVCIEAFRAVIVQWWLRLAVAVFDSKTDIRNQQRNGRKSVTTVQGLDKAYDLKKMVRALKKEFSCNGTVIEDPEHGSIIQLQGDQRHAVKEFLARESICSVDQIRIHGV